MASGSDDFCYSGAFGAYVYCHNALSKVDKTAASQIWSTLSDGVVTDLRAANEHYAQYEGKVQDARVPGMSFSSATQSSSRS